MDTSSGEIATGSQLAAAGIDEPERPWLRIQGPDDATTLWHAVMVKQERGIFIATMTLRHGDHHRLLAASGWDEIAPERIGTSLSDGGSPSTVSPSPWTGSSDGISTSIDPEIVEPD